MTTALCQFVDGVSFELEVNRGETLLDAAQREGVPIQHQCRSGSCLSCICSSTSGGLVMRAGKATSLLPADIAAGQRLACSAELLGDDTLSFGYESNPRAPKQVQAFVNVVEQVCSDAVRLEVELADGHWLDFEPGQYVNITPPGAASARSFSMSSIPDDLPRMEFYVRLLERGLMSDYLRNQAKPDDVLTLEGPFGRFTRDSGDTAPLLFIAGGTGISPVLSLARQARLRKGRKPPMTLNFGCATDSRLFAEEALELLESWTPSLNLNIFVEDGSAATYPAGNPVQGIEASSLTPDTKAYVCGPPAMVSAAAQHLQQLGLSAESIHYEQFTPAVTGEV